MQSHLVSLSNPRWMNEEHTVINCDIKTTQFGDEVLPFTASLSDPEPHGRAIFMDVLSNKYGNITEFTSTVLKDGISNG